MGHQAVDMVHIHFRTQVETHTLPDFMLTGDAVSLPWQMVCYLLVGLITIIVVSLFTRPMDKAGLDSFYECLRTPIAPNEPETEPFTLPEGVEPAPRQVWLDHPDFEFPRPTLIGVVGFFAGWAAVGLLIAVFLWIVRA